jgi:hypothetical protein
MVKKNMHTNNSNTVNPYENLKYKFVKERNHALLQLLIIKLSLKNVLITKSILYRINKQIKGYSN